MSEYEERGNGSAVTSIIALNLAVFLAWNIPGLTSPEFMVENFLVSWTAVFEEGRPWTLLTSVFSHNALLHFFLNMYVLFSFGKFVEYLLGVRRFVTFYIVAGIVASLSHAAVSAFLLGRAELPALGASGSVSGVILLFSLLFPRERILLMGLVPVPALVGALLFVGLDVWGLVSQVGGSGLPIGHGAHLGGAAIGLLYFLILRIQRGRR